MSETSSLSALCQFEKTGVGATLMGRPIRFDEASGLLSVKDVIEVIEGVQPDAARKAQQRLIDDDIISEGTNTGFAKFKIGKHQYVIFPFFHL